MDRRKVTGALLAVGLIGLLGYGAVAEAFSPDDGSGSDGPQFACADGFVESGNATIADVIQGIEIADGYGYALSTQDVNSGDDAVYRYATDWTNPSGWYGVDGTYTQDMTVDDTGDIWVLHLLGDNDATLIEYDTDDVTANISMDKTGNTIHIGGYKDEVQYIDETFMVRNGKDMFIYDTNGDQTDSFTLGTTFDRVNSMATTSDGLVIVHGAVGDYYDRDNKLVVYDDIQNRSSVTTLTNTSVSSGESMTYYNGTLSVQQQSLVTEYTCID